ncbi:MAG: 1-acyl-sn-glycerol-3-phosphate acyltransferase [Ruminococcaceae bacterium]|nr:1-acyl-sn-glycerol-3-phosphate acyltransferase [Oscillospiraceae bacterium]
MKIKTVKKSYDEVMALPRPEHKRPKKPWFLLRTLIRVLSVGDLSRTNFSYNFEDREDLPEGPYLILMNHSSFIDLKIVSKIFYPMPYAIVCTSDGLVGKNWLMRRIGCISTQKFVTDVTLIKDIKYALKKQKISVLMYPEASYSFDGTATPLPDKFGGLIKMMKVPVIMVKTYGAFALDPLYNCLQRRKVDVTADVKCILRPEDIEEKSVAQIDKILKDAFTFDNFAWQYENRVEIDEGFRADGLERILYKCDACGVEGKMEGRGTQIVCHACGRRHTLNTLGRLQASDGKTRFSHIPDWYKWERECVRESIENGTYLLDTEVDIGMMVDYKAIYMVGSGRLRHTGEGFSLRGCDGKLVYDQKPLSSYGLYSDYFWYEIGDMICIGNRDALYYCFPKKEGVVAKTRLAAEELYKIRSAEARRKKKEEKASAGAEAAQA